MTEGPPTPPAAVPDAAAPATGVQARWHQMFPVLTDGEIARIARFGDVRRYARGTRIFSSGERTPGMLVVLAGRIGLRQRDGLGHATPIASLARGQFSGEVAQLSGRPALVDADALEEVEARVVPPDALRALIIAEADLGERIVRALILRRVGLLETNASGPVLIAGPASPLLPQLRNFLTRAAHPHQVFDAESDAASAALRERYGATANDVLALCPNGSVLLNPSEAALARCLGILDTSPHVGLFDVAVVGAGPAGLATAVYAASEGLRVVVLDCRAYGGQAGASSRIENYLGFPTGISGQALAGRAFVQAQKFGAEILIPAQAAALDCASGDLAVHLSDGQSLRARTVVIASGARYRRPDVPRLDEFEGRGVWYWASALEAKACAGIEVALVGGGNSAGQAAVFLAQQAKMVHILVRGPGLAATMSRYLIDRIEATSNIALHAHTELVQLHGAPGERLDAITWRDRQTGVSSRQAIRHVFLFVGADPETRWLAGCPVRLDAHGFVLTGEADATTGSRATLEASVPGVFAVGDVRAGSVKRVGGAIGEGAAVVAQIHQFLARVPAAAQPASGTS
jgi:thioredoxin reductase (NADPH)